MEFNWNPIYQDNYISLPETKEKVLISVIYGENGKLETDVYPSYYDKNKKRWDLCDPNEIVVAWAKMPEPYMSIDLNKIININNLIF